ncbi:MAG: hypothetical protein QG591_2298 [Planctomycetota bacterium]|nr:hypothetical protein [Planctomycetota bacterium]
MCFAGIKELKHSTMDILKESENEDIIITAYGKPVAILHHITEEDLTDYLIENDPVFKTRIEEAYTEYLVNGGVPADAIMKKLEKRRGTKEV